MKAIWGIFTIRTTRKESIMGKHNDTEKTRAALAARQQASTHKPATQCSCGTWRTPGQTHTAGNAGPSSPEIMTRMCNQ